MSKWDPYESERDHIKRLPKCNACSEPATYLKFWERLLNWYCEKHLEEDK